MDPLQRLILKKQNPTLFTETVQELEAELYRVTTIVYRSLRDDYTFSDIILDRSKEIGYPIAPEFFKYCLQIVIDKVPESLYLAQLDDIGFVIIENDIVRINPQYLEEYLKWLDETTSYYENISNYSDKNASASSDSSSDTSTDIHVENNYEWSWKKLFVITFFGIIVLKEIYDYFNNKSKSNSETLEEENTSNIKKVIKGEEQSNEENTLKSVYEETFDPMLIEVLVKIFVPYSIYMVYKFRYYIYYKYFKL